MKAKQARELGRQISACVHTGDLDQAYALLAPVLAERTRFAKLDLIGEAVVAGPLEPANAFLDQIAAHKTEGGWVVIGQAMGQQLRRDLPGAFDRCRRHITASDVWYGADILGERVPGPATEMLTALAVRVARRDEAILALILYSGIRVGELVDLRLSDVEIGEQSGRVKITAKGRKYREVPLHVNVRHTLSDWLEVRPEDEETDHFFVGKGGPDDATWGSAAVEQDWGCSGVQVTPHVLRHTFATRLLREAQVDIVTTSNLMGHENITTTTIYTQPTDADLEEAVAKL